MVSVWSVWSNAKMDARVTRERVLLKLASLTLPHIITILQLPVKTQVLDEIIYNTMTKGSYYCASGGAFVATTVKLPIPTEKIAEFCQRWGIVELALFGSVLSERFRDESDVDVLVEFAPDAMYTFGQLLTMEEELEVIFGRSVDFIDKAALQESPNYLRRRDIFGSAQAIYANR